MRLSWPRAIRINQRAPSTYRSSGKPRTEIEIAARPISILLFLAIPISLPFLWVFFWLFGRFQDPPMDPMAILLSGPIMFLFGYLGLRDWRRFRHRVTGKIELSVS